ncbi:hypothetical protein P7C70_g6134, partial [Phenoliferia sp. Uapishka_3]
MSDPSFAHVPKAVLCSVWSAVPVLTAHEKGFTETQLEKRFVNLLEGQNFAPSFLKSESPDSTIPCTRFDARYLTVSPKGTLPALVAPFEHTLTSGIATKFRAVEGTISICQFLDQSTNGPSAHSAPSLSPATMDGSTDSNFIIDLVHSPTAPDPNMLGISFRNEQERKAKAAGFPGKFLQGRQDALEKYAKEAGDEDGRLAAFYRLKIKENGDLLAMMKGDADSSAFQKLSQEAWVLLAKTIATFEEKLDGKNAFIVGDQIALADLHAGAFFARILAASGSKDATGSETHLLDAQLPEGQKVGPKLKSYLTTLFARESFKNVYHDGLH